MKNVSFPQFKGVTKLSSFTQGDKSDRVYSQMKNVSFPQFKGVTEGEIVKLGLKTFFYFQKNA